MKAPGKYLLALFALSLLANDAFARAIRLDGTLQEFRFTGGGAPPNVLTNNGSSGAIDIQSYNVDMNNQPDFNNPLTFGVNIFGTMHSQFYVNENGSISFGGGFGGTPGNSDPSNAGIPVFAPFFADVDSDLSPVGGSVSHGFFPGVNGIAITWGSVGFDGQDTNLDDRRVSMQVIIRDISGTTGNAGDFRLEFNHRGGSGGMEWETGDSDGGVNGLGGSAPLAGFWNGLGMGYELPGSGVNGAFLGDDCMNNSTALSCNDYFFDFVNGVPFFANGSPVFSIPEPPLVALFGIGIGMLAWSRRPRTLAVESRSRN